MIFVRNIGPALGLAAALLAAPAYAEDWVTVDNADGTFHFAAPVQPTAKSDRGTDGDVGFNETVYTATSGGLIVIGDYSVYDPGAHVVDPKLVLQGFVGGLKAQLISSEDKPYERGPGDALPGLLASAQNDQVTCHFRVAADGLRVFALAACGRAGTDETADIDRTIASFTVTK